MPNHQLNEVKALVAPTLHETNLASETILTELGKGIEHTDNLKAAVARRLAGEPLSIEGIEGVTETAVRALKAVGATVVALAHLESTGHILPFGESRVRQWPERMIPYNYGGRGSGYQAGDQFNYAVADVYILPMTGLAPEADAPAVFLDHLPASIGPKVRRVLVEAADAYRARLFVGTAMLLGTASEAAWEQLAARAQQHSGDAKLLTLLADPLTPAGHLQTRTVDVLKMLKVSASDIAALDAISRAYRDLRNHAVHEPEASFDETLFARSVVGTLLTGAVKYFQRLYNVLDRL